MDKLSSISAEEAPAAMTPELANSGSLFSSINNNIRGWNPSRAFCATGRNYASLSNDFSKTLHRRGRDLSEGGPPSCMSYSMLILMYFIKWMFDIVIGFPFWWCFAISLSICNDFVILLFNFEQEFHFIVSKKSTIKLSVNKITTKMKPCMMMENLLNPHFNASKLNTQRTVAGSCIS